MSHSFKLGYARNGTLPKYNTNLEQSLNIQGGCLLILESISIFAIQHIQKHNTAAYTADYKRNL